MKRLGRRVQALDTHWVPKGNNSHGHHGEPGWEKTLTGVPKEICRLWDKYFRPRGYKLLVEIADYPGGMPGDVGMRLKWL